MRREQPNISCLLALDKPAGPTSHDMVARVRRALGERRVGHAGTLDPAASGVLVIGVGQATRLLGLLALDRKAYVARIVLGAETTTDDAEGDVTHAAIPAAELADEARAREVVASLAGPCEQVPPAFSAAHVGGRRAYERARAGEVPELAPRHVTIYAATLLGVEAGAGTVAWTCAFEVSKGTYVRSIARDLGRSLGCGGHLGELRRTASGAVTLGMCVREDELEGAGLDAALRAIDPLVALGLAWRRLSEREAADASHGRRIPAGTLCGRDGTAREAGAGERVALVSGDRLVGVWHEAAGMLACDVNLPGGVIGVRA